jgi:hypothetical protein
MVDQKVASVASQAAYDHINKELTLYWVEKPLEVEIETVYAAAFRAVLEERKVTSEGLKGIIREYVKKNFPEKDRAAVTGNLIKESQRTSMNQKVFRKLVIAVLTTAAPS